MFILNVEKRNATMEKHSTKELSLKYGELWHPHNVTLFRLSGVNGFFGPQVYTGHNI